MFAVPIAHADLNRLAEDIALLSVSYIVLRASPLLTSMVKWETFSSKQRKCQDCPPARSMHW